MFEKHRAFLCKIVGLPLLLKIVLFGVLLLEGQLLPSTSSGKAFASSNGSASFYSAGEAHFLIGYHHYLKRQNGGCAEHFLRATDLPKALGDRAALYLAKCQYELGYRDAAAYHLHEVQETEWTSRDKILFEKLRSRLTVELSRVRTVYYTLSPYYYQIGFSSNAIKKASSGLGALGSVRKKDFEFRAGMDGSEISFNSSSLEDYKQLLSHIDFGIRFGNSGVFRLGATYIAANYNTYNDSKIGNAVLGFDLGATTRGQINLDYSSYPSSTLTDLKIYQGSFGIAQQLWGRGYSTFWMNLTGTIQSAQSSLSIDPITGFRLNSTYSKANLDLTFTTERVDFLASGWTGTEAFGVRNDGFTVFNAMEEHRAGWSGAITARLTTHWSMTGKIGQELYIVDSPQFTATYWSLLTVLSF